MLKPVLAATAIFALAGSSFVYAQQRFDGNRGFGNDGPRAEHQHRRMSADDVAAFGDARIAALKAGLELTPDQTKNWPAFESALHNMVQLRVQRIQARQARLAAAGQQDQAQTPATPTTPATPFDRMARRADAMSKRSAALKQIADAGAPLYASLNDTQKTRFTELARMLRPHHNMHASNGGNWREGRADGQDGRGWGYGGRRFGQYGGQDGGGWGHGRRFGENDQGDGQGDGQGGHFGPDGRGHGGMHNLSNDDGDQDSQL